MCRVTEYVDTLSGVFDSGWPKMDVLGSPRIATSGVIMEETIQPDYQAFLNFWFGSVEQTVIPTRRRACVWFGDNVEVNKDICIRFSQAHQDAIMGKLAYWEKMPHGQLALILLYDQLSRHLFLNSAEAFDYDGHALKVCLLGLGRVDHELSLIERVFFYFPLLHAENLEIQQLSLQCYDVLLSLALPETKLVYDSFLRFASHHYSIIRQFGRFPQRNRLLGRDSTAEELAYLKEEEGG